MTMLLQCSMRQRLRITSPRMKNQSLAGRLSLTFGLGSQFAFSAQFAASYWHKSMSRWSTVKQILRSRRKRASKRLIRGLTARRTRTERRNPRLAARRASWTNTSRDYRDLYCCSWWSILLVTQACMRSTPTCPNSSRPSSNSPMWMLDTYHRSHIWLRVSRCRCSEQHSTTSAIRIMKYFCWPLSVWSSLCTSLTSHWVMLQRKEPKEGSFVCSLLSFLDLVMHYLQLSKVQQCQNYSRIIVNCQTFWAQSRSQKAWVLLFSPISQAIFALSLMGTVGSYSCYVSAQWRLWVPHIPLLRNKSQLVPKSSI